MAGAAESLAHSAGLLRPVGFEALEGWAEDDYAAAFAAFLLSCRRALSHPPRRRGLGVDVDSLRQVAEAALDLDDAPPLQARRFFEEHFRPMEVAAEGFVTGYYEPELEASPCRTERFTVPLYRRPPDLAEIDEASRPFGWDPAVRFVRRAAEGLVPYPDRAAIEAGALAGRGLEIAWLEDPVDAYFVHVQGSARLHMAGRGLVRLAFDGKSGHPYTSIGRLAVERGWLRHEQADKEGLQAWLRANPEAGGALMRENRSFIFFRETPELGPADGPLGAAGVPLTPGRSLAVDRTLWSFHLPVWVASDLDPARLGRPFRRLMVAQDTGSAIVGPARGDLFIGSGEAAGRIAGAVRHAARMTVLVPRADGAAA
jgi:membrane-bound lytic murein transglycosylase A